MAERRSLVAGIEEIGVDPEIARAFIVQEKPKAEPKPQSLRAVPDSEPVPAKAAAPVTTEDEPADEVEEGRKASAPAKRPAKPAAQKRTELPRLLGTLLIPVTVRLRPEIASALKRASLERQLNGIETYTQQDIVEEALLPWLQAEGLID
jgi:hypothetical protein